MNSKDYKTVNCNRLLPYNSIFAIGFANRFSDKAFVFFLPFFQLPTKWLNWFLSHRKNKAKDTIFQIECVYVYIVYKIDWEVFDFFCLFCFVFSPTKEHKLKGRMKTHTHTIRSSHSTRIRFYRLNFHFVCFFLRPGFHFSRMRLHIVFG